MGIWKKSLLVQIIGSFLVLSLIGVTLVGVAAFDRAKSSLTQAVFDRLTLAVSLKEAEIDRWLLDRARSLQSLADLPPVRDRIEALSLEGEDGDREFLDEILQTFADGESGLKEVFLLSRSSRIIASSDSQGIGQYEPRVQYSKLVFAANPLPNVNIYADPNTGRPQITFETPISNKDGQNLGSLAAHLDLERIDTIVSREGELGETGESYIVGNVGGKIGGELGQRYVFVTAVGFGSPEFADGLSSEGINAAMEGKSDRGLYRNYRGIPAIGVYRFLERQDIALIAEQSQQEAFAPARDLAIAITAIGLGCSVFLALGMWIVARQIVRPIAIVAKTARQVSEGVQRQDFHALPTTPVLAKNEIGTLAKAFNQTVLELQSAYGKLTEYSHDLESKVEQRTQELSQNNAQLQKTLKQLKIAQAQLIQTEKMAGLGQLVAGIAHELNNPVSFIYGNTEHLRSDILDLLHLVQLYQQEFPLAPPKIREFLNDIDLEFVADDLPKMLESIATGARRIRDIVLSLRIFARLDEAGIKPVDLVEGIESTLLVLKSRLNAQPKRPAIIVAKDYQSLPPIKCNAGQMNQVFLNILTNAIDALEEAIAQDLVKTPTLTIQTQLLSEERVTIAIADNGIGMTEAVRGCIFEPFFTTKPVGKGVGLGLSICYSIVVEQHGGRLSCESQRDRGTMLTIELPRPL
ncbi:MAG: HAMP domain-containing protein [Cyanobacteria bacterium SBLK]|nr:HAMP domain-containing protein [Cyanobacteria bacterium SBLK]